MNYNPYQVLGLDQYASPAQIRQAYLNLGLQYHPDKGGDVRMFQLIHRAYRDIMMMQKGTMPTQAQQTAGYVDLKQGYNNYNQPQPDYTNQTFDLDSFNAKFRQAPVTTNEPDYTFDISEADYVERTKSQFDRDYAMVNSQLGSTQRLFNHGSFNQNSFNHMFNLMKEAHRTDIRDIDHYQEPEAAIQAGTEIPSSCINDARNTQNMSSLGSSDYQQIFHKSHHNPHQIDHAMMQRLAQQQDITRVDRMNQGQMKDRLNQYQNVDFNIPRGGSIDFSKPIPPGQLYTGEAQQQPSYPGIAPSSEMAYMQKVRERQQVMPPSYHDFNQQRNLYNPIIENVEENRLVPYTAESDEVSVLRNQMKELQQTVDVQHRLLKKLASNKGYKVV